MDEHFVQGVVGGVLNRHKNRTLDKNRIAVLSVESKSESNENSKVDMSAKAKRGKK